MFSLLIACFLLPIEVNSTYDVIGVPFELTEESSDQSLEIDGCWKFSTSGHLHTEKQEPQGYCVAEDLGLVLGDTTVYLDSENGTKFRVQVSYKGITVEQEAQHCSVDVPNEDEPTTLREARGWLGCE